MGDLRVVRAGAGSGKTYDLCQHIAGCVAAGLDPAKILATTFTRKAAAELKGRIQARLLAHRDLPPAVRLAKAERLELGVIGTVHSVGHQLLIRYALPLGLSPDLTVLEEVGSSRALQDLLAQMDPHPWEELAAVTQRFSLEAPQDLVLKLLDAKRGNDIGDGAFPGHLETDARRLSTVMAPAGPLAGRFTFDDLYVLMGRVLDALEKVTDGVNKTEEAKHALRQLLARRARTWRAFIDAGRLEAGKKSGADTVLQARRVACAEILRLPDLHADVGVLLAGLAARTLALDKAYAGFKRERGLLDFIDLEVWLLRLLNRADLCAGIQRSFELVGVDEFHDTNPLQLAIFQRLRALAAASRWVGDAKQSIYGFRGTDPDLVRAVWDNVPEVSRERLTRNYRSQAGLVQLVGRHFRPAFGAEAELTPVRPGAARGIERWVIEARNNEQEFAALAAGIAQLRDERVPLRAIAVLARTNDDARAIGAACKTLGLAVLLKLPGLLATREGALTLAGLRLVADRSDSLAAATIAHLLGDPREPTPAWLTGRLQALRDVAVAREAGLRESSWSLPPPWGKDPRFTDLQAIDHRALPPSAIVARLIDALRIGNALRDWGDAARRAANLDSLVALSMEYEEEAQELRLVPTLSGLIAHLERLADEGKDETRPPYGIDAATILTYHGSKGLQWQIVILTGLGSEPSPHMWQPVVRGGDPQAGNPLAGRRIRYWPWPFGGLRKTGLLGTPGLDELALASPEGQEAAERGRAESLRLLYVGFTRAEDRLVLAHREGKDAWLRMLPDVDAILPPNVVPGEHPLQGIETTYLLRRLDASMAEALRRPAPEEESWLVPLRSPESAPVHGPRYWSPSEAEAAVPPEAVTLEALFGEPVFPKMEDAEEAALGNAVHTYLTALPSLEDLPANERRQVAARCLQGFGAEALIAADQLVSMGERLSAWVVKTYPGAIWHTEMPVTAPRNGGGQWNGMIDLLLRLSSGEVVVIDHKTSPIRADQCAAKAATFGGQLAAYRAALEAQGLTVAGTWIHFPLAAAVAQTD
jgi:ATP-dependent exoDNAse (exonuclease V) beta subunit